MTDREQPPAGEDGEEPTARSYLVVDAVPALSGSLAHSVVEEAEEPTPRAQLRLRLVPPPAEDTVTEGASGKDDAYYAEIRASVGRGTPSLLLGTSRRALDRSVERLRRAQREE